MPQNLMFNWTQLDYKGCEHLPVSSRSFMQKQWVVHQIFKNVSLPWFPFLSLPKVRMSRSTQPISSFLTSHIGPHYTSVGLYDQPSKVTASLTDELQCSSAFYSLLSLLHCSIHFQYSSPNSAIIYVPKREYCSSKGFWIMKLGTVVWNMNHEVSFLHLMRSCPLEYSTWGVCCYWSQSLDGIMSWVIS